MPALTRANVPTPLEIVPVAKFVLPIPVTVNDLLPKVEALIFPLKVVPAIFAFVSVLLALKEIFWAEAKIDPSRMLSVPLFKTISPEPKFAGLETDSVPALSVNPPLNVFSPDRVSWPAPVFVSVVPRTILLTTTAAPVSTLIVPPEAPKLSSRLLLKLKLAPLLSTPPFNTRWFELASAGGAPRFASAVIFKTPPLIVVEPVNVLAPLSVKVPADKINDPSTPEITPSIVPVEFEIVKTFAPSNMVLSAAAVMVFTVALLVTPLMSKAALLVTPLDA